MDPLRIIELRASNIKRLKAVAIRPDGSLVQITGANGAGKSAVLDSITMTLAGTKDHPSQPIRKGESVAKVEINLGPITVTRKFTESGTTLEVSRTDDGSVLKKGQTALDGIVGELTFDPLAFTRLTPKQQLELLRGLVTLDIDLDALDRKRAEAFEHRTDVNRRVKTLQERVDTLEAGLDPAMDVTLIDTTALMDRMENAAQLTATIERLKAQEDGRQRQIAEKDTVIAEMQDRIARMQDQLTVVVRERETLLSIPAAQIPEPEDVATVRRELQDADRLNSARTLQARQRSTYQEAVAQRDAAAKQADALSALITECDAAKVAAIASAKMPIDGLSFGDGAVIYNGLPLDQASSAEQVRVATAIGMAMNPRLRILLIKDGSLLDERSLAEIGKLAEANDFQVWIERVDTSGKAGIVMEDGEIVGASIDAPALALVGAGD